MYAVNCCILLKILFECRVCETPAAGFGELDEEAVSRRWL